MKRKVSVAALFRLLKNKRPYGVLAFVFVILSFMLMLFLSFFAVVFKGENSDYNFNQIEKYGLQKDARVTYIKTVHNIEVNGENPVVISYEYEDNGRKVKDKFETLDLENVANFDIGSSIKILVYNNQTMIKDVEPYGFPDILFYLIPLPFFAVGVILLLIVLIPALEIYNLYKYGVIKDAVIESIGFKGGVASFSNFKAKPVARYYFTDEHLNKAYGETEITDFLFLMGKKEGDTIKIFVSKKDQSRSCVVPSIEVIKNNWNLSATQLI